MHHLKAFVVWIGFNVGHDVGLALIGRYVEIPLWALGATVVGISLVATWLAWRLEHTPHQREIERCQARIRVLEARYLS